jgi:negative regulator of sigma-B (phosphoserine phosphatase)
MRTTTISVAPGDVLVLATDGIEPAFADPPDIAGSPQAISERILAGYGRSPDDDALVIAVRYLGRRA